MLIWENYWGDDGLGTAARRFMSAHLGKLLLPSKRLSFLVVCCLCSFLDASGLLLTTVRDKGKVW